MKWYLIILLSLFNGIVFSQTVSDEEKAGVVRMREEEKMARDVYLTLNEKWELQVFSHISESESYHMTQMKMWIDKFKLDDPVTANKDKRGVFTDQLLQQLYGELTASGIQNKEAAFRAAAKVEEVDILDLKKVMNETSNEDLKATYRYLIRASENHLRAFVRNLKNLGINYKPILMYEKEFDEIINKGTGGKGPGKNGRKNCGMDCCIN